MTYQVIERMLVTVRIGQRSSLDIETAHGVEGEEGDVYRRALNGVEERQIKAPCVIKVR